MYDALNQGDGSLREPHFTSLLFYLFRVSKEEFPQSSYIDDFISRYVPNYPLTTDCIFDVVSDLKIEEVLTYDDFRRDTDIVILSRGVWGLKIINIENKINFGAIQNGQIEDQHRLLENIYPNSEIRHILILPFSNEQTFAFEANLEVQIIYWHSEQNSLIESISEYINDLLTENNLDSDKANFLSTFLHLFRKFSFILEQDCLSVNNRQRGRNVPYRHSMFEYLSDIAMNWEFDDAENVTVENLINKFEDIVTSHLRIDYPNDHVQFTEKFRNGALEIQPKIFTINERNRVNFNITNENFNNRNLFYYPDFPDGNYKMIMRWKEMRIKPLSLFANEGQFHVFYKNNISNQIEFSFYGPEV